MRQVDEARGVNGTTLDFLKVMNQGLKSLHPRSINRRKAYGAIPGKSLARVNVRGTFSL